MSIIQAMYAGASALTNFGESMTVIGNNLANSNTTAFKSSSASFQDVLIQTVGSTGAGASTQVGTGVGLADVQQNLVQGSFSASTNVTDLSIDGRGFFVVKDPTAAGKLNESGKPKDTYYTRAGNFRKDLTGNLVTPGGMVLQGWELTPDGQQIPKTTNIDLSKFTNADPTATTLVTAGINLDSSVKAITPGTKYDPNDPSTYNFSTAVRVFDSRGTGHALEIQFRKLPMASPATAVGGLGVSSSSQSAGSLVENGATQTIPLGNLPYAKQQVAMTFTPVVGGVPGVPIVTDAIVVEGANPSVSTDQLQVKGASLGLTNGTTYMVSYATTRQEIGLDLDQAANVYLTFTPVNGGTPIVADPIALSAGHTGLDLRTEVVSNGAPLALEKGIRYTIGYTTDPAETPASGTTPAVKIVTALAGDDSRAAVEGVNNDNTWEWHAVAKTDELDPKQKQGGPGGLTALTSLSAVPSGAGYTAGQLVFDSQGKLLQEGSTPVSILFAGITTAPVTGGAAVTPSPQEILFDFGSAVGKNGDSTNDFSKKTTDLVYGTGKLVEESGAAGGSGSLQVAGGFATVKLDQNGFPSGYIDKIAIDATGTVSGSYTNGQTKKLYQISLVDFADEAALSQKGSNLFAETVASGLPLSGAPQTGRLGSVVAYSLEQSNVDMSGEFVKMIATQRGFQANSRIVTVVDGMMEELLSLKR
ncbi:MAG: flagellar hook-basal body complex protein [Magnetococcus sp. YQC-3]